MAVNIKFTAQENEVIASLRAMGGETARLVDENIRLAQAFAKSDAQAKFFSRGIDRVKKETEALTKAQKEQSAASRISNGVQGMLGAQLSGPMAGVGGALGGGVGLAVGASLDGLIAVGKEVVSVTEKYNRLQIALDSATGSSNMGARSMAFIIDLAAQTGQRIETLGNSYKTLAANARGTLLEGKGVEKIFSAIVKAGSAMQLSNEQIKGSLKAVSDMMNKSKIQAEELTQQFSENFPGGAKIFADALGITTAELFKLGEQGKLIAADTLPKVAAYMEKMTKDDYAKNLNTITGSMNNFRNQLDLVLVSFGNESNINKFFAAVINGAASALKSPSFIKFSEMMLAMVPGVGTAFAAYGALKGTPVKGAPDWQEQSKFGSQSIKEQARQLQALYARMRDLKRLADPKSNLSNNSEQLKKAQADLAQVIVTYSALKGVYDSARATAAASAKVFSAGAKVQQKSLTDLNKEIKENTRLYRENILNIPGYQASEGGKSALAKIDALKAEYKTLKELSSTGLSKDKTGGRTAFSKEYNEAAKELKRNLEEAYKNWQKVGNVIERATFNLRGNFDVNNRLGIGKEGDLTKLIPSSKGLNGAKDTKMVIPLPDMKVQSQKLKDWMNWYEGEADEIRAGMTAKNKQLQSTMAEIGMSIGGAFEAFGAALANRENPFKAFGNFLVNSLGDVLVKVGTQMLIQAAAFYAGVPLTLGLTAPQAARFAIGGAIMTTAGGALKATKFAKGGIVSGPTYSMTGEYPGARNNPEVIAPLNRLGQLFQPYFQKAINMSPSGQNAAMQPVYLNPTVYLDGKVLATQLQKVYIQKGRTN